MRSSGDHGAGDAERPYVPRAQPPRPYDPRVTGRPRGGPADAGQDDFTGPQASSELPGYEFEVPYRRRDTGEFSQLRDTDGFGRARETGGFSRVRRTDDFDALPDVDPVLHRRDSGGFRAPRDSGAFPAARDPRTPRALPPAGGRDARRDSGAFGAVRDSGGFNGMRDSGGFDRRGDSGGFRGMRDPGEQRPSRDSGGFRANRNSGGFDAPRDSGGFGAVRNSGAFDAVRDSGGFGAVRDPGEGRPARDSGGFRGPRHSGSFPAARHSRPPRALPGPPGPSGPDAARGSGGFGAVRDSGGYDAAQRAGGFRPPRDSGSFPAARDPHAPRALPPTGGPGAVRGPGGFGSARDSGGFGAARNSGSFGAVRDPGGFRAARNSGGFGADPYADGSDAVRDSGGFDAPRHSGGFPAARDSGGFGAVRDSGGFGAARNTGGFGAVRDSGGFDAPRDSGGLGAVRDSGGMDRLRDSGGFHAARDAGGFDEARDTGPRRPLTLRYTPTVATSGPLGPVPPPPEFTEPRRRSGPQTRPRLRQPSGPGTRQRSQPPPRPQGSRELAAPPERRESPMWREPRERRTTTREPRGAPEAAYEERARSASHGRPGPRHGAGRHDRDGLDGQRDLGILRRLRYPADQLAEQGLAARLGRDFAAAMRSRNWVSGLAVPIVAAIAVGIAVVVVAGANNGSGPAPSSLDAGYPPARAATADFTDTPALAGRGIQAPLGQVATFGTTIVAVGGQSGARIPRARFYVSADNGKTWQLGTVQGDPAPGQAAALVAGGSRGWVAVGPAAVWTSQNAHDWVSHPQLPQLAGDQITTLTATGSGFLAAGTNVPGGNGAKASPVVWLSANGTTWQRLGVTQLGLAAGNGRVLGITGAAASGGAIVMTGTVAGAGTASGAWQSANGGTTWTAVTVPAGGGASATIAGLAPLRGGFVAVRSAPEGGSTGAAVYTSANGTAWQQSATLRTADGSPLTLGPVSGGPTGAVVSGQAHGLDIAFLSPDGKTWTGTDPAGTATAEQVSGVALTAAGQAVFSGTGTATAAEQQPVLTLIGAQGAARQVNIGAIPGAVTTELAINAIAAAGTTQVAAGSADGLPALWVSTDGGSTWTRGTGATQAVLGRQGDEQITGVAHGAAGWLAVGGGTTAAQGPVVVGSPDGRTWTALDGAAAFAGQGQVVTAAAAGPAGYVIAGHQLTGGRTVAAAWYAPGGTDWQKSAIALPATGDSQLNAVTATGTGFVAVGSAGTSAAAWLSPTGRTWSLVTVPRPAGAASAQLDFVAANGTTIAATGTEVTAAGQRVPFAAVSANGGTTWTLAELPAPAARSGTAANTTVTGVTALAAAGSGFTATGTYGTPGSQDVVIWTLAAHAAAGTAWTAASPDGTGLAGPGTHAITALAVAGSTLTGVGYIATPAAEEPTIWQSPVRN
jgi:hypothetical protein